MPHLHVAVYDREHGIVREHVSRAFGRRIVSQIRPRARLALQCGFDDRRNAVAHIGVNVGKTRIGHVDGIKRGGRHDGWRD